MNKIYSVIALLGLSFCLGSTQLFSQNPTNCDGSRYIDDLFTATTPVTVKFGENTSIGNNFQELYMDVYEPANDGAAMRPVIVFAFGGSFITGTREDMANTCQLYAEKGYVAVSIDYRLYDGSFFPLPDSTKMMEEVIMAMGDMKAAIRYLRKDAATTNQFRIDPDNIFVGGVSAGAIVADHVAYITDLSEAPAYLATIANNNGGLEGNTDDPNNSSMGYPSDVQGVINLFGALHRSSFLSAEDPPITSIHGTGDNIVPYGQGSATIFGLPIVTMEGSGAMHLRADQVGVWNHLVTVPDGGHGDFMGDPFWADSVYNTAARMMEDIVCEAVATNLDEAIDVSRQVVAFPNPSVGDMSIAFNGLNEAYDLVLFDNMGRLIQSFSNLNEDLLQLDKADFAPGFYQARIQFKNQDLAPVVKKLVFAK